MRISDWSSDVCSSDLKKLLPLFRIEEHHPNWNLSPGVVGVISHRLPPQYLARHRIRYKQRRATRPIVAAFEHDALPKDAAPAGCDAFGTPGGLRSEEHTSELQSLMRISYAVFCLKKKTSDIKLENTL